MGMAPSATTYIEENASIVSNGESIKLDHNGHQGSKSSEELVAKTLKDRISIIDTDICEAGEEDAFFVADLGEVYRQHLRWKMNLKRVKPHYGEHLAMSICCTMLIYC